MCLFCVYFVYIVCIMYIVHVGYIVYILYIDTRICRIYNMIYIIPYSRSSNQKFRQSLSSNQTPLAIFTLLVFYILATLNIISHRVPTCVTVDTHGDFTVLSPCTIVSLVTMMQYLTQSHYPFTDQPSPRSHHSNTKRQAR